MTANTGNAVDTWARDLATEAKEMSVRTASLLEAHDKYCREDRENATRWRENATAEMRAVREAIERSAADISKRIWGLVLLVVTGGGAVLWTLIKTQAGIGG